MEEKMENIVAAIIGAICAGWIAWFITKRNTDRTILATFALNRIQERRKAIAEFRLAFLDLLLFLKEDIKPKEFTDFHSFLGSSFTHHAAAIIKFTPYLDRTGIRRINEAWFDYKFPNGIAEGKENKEAFPLHDYTYISEPEKVALEKIENLLSVGSHNKIIL